jgi:hypothetical protein
MAHDDRRARVASALRERPDIRVVEAFDVSSALTAARRTRTHIAYVLGDPVYHDGDAIALCLALEEHGHNPRTITATGDITAIIATCRTHLDHAISRNQTKRSGKIRP